MLNGPYVPRRGKPEGSGLDIDKAEVVEVLFYLLAECIIRFQLLFPTVCWPSRHPNRPTRSDFRYSLTSRRCSGDFAGFTGYAWGCPFCPSVITFLN